jgi:SPP1 gp7 family putative phage head morphogenesis protein
VASLTPWGPSDAHAVPLVELLTRAEAGVLAVLRDELRGDGLDRRAHHEVGHLASPAAVHVAALLGNSLHAPVGDLESPAAGLVDCVGHRLDSITSALARVRSVLDRLLGNATISRVVTGTGERAREASERLWAEQVSRELGQRYALDTGPGRERLQAWIAENTARIQGLRNATLEQVRADLETAVLSQVRPSELAAHWERVGLPTRNGTLRGRALVIARDQLGTLASQLAQEQQQALGVEEYDWDATFEVTRKHRAVHRGRHGARYRWDSPPPDGHPGRAVCCGCKPRAVVDRADLRKRFGVRA